MKRLSLLGVSILVCLPLSNFSVVPYITIRSQSVDSARELVGWTDKINLYDMENLYVTGAITIEGTRSFNSDSIARSLFGIQSITNFDDELAVRVTGSQVANRQPGDWLADYFGLSPEFQSTLTFKPRISNLLIDFNLYVGFDEWVEGLYFRVHAPVTATRWDLNFNEIIQNSGTLTGYPAGYFSPSAVPLADLLPNATAYFSQEDYPLLDNGVTFSPLMYARFERTRQHKTALAEIQAALGYNFLLCDDYHLGGNFRVDAPTGNRPHGLFVFEPIVGNGKHWAVGGGFTGHYTFWRACDDESSCGIYIDGNFTHLFSASQVRTFDIKGKPVSRYMLAEQLGTPVMNLFASSTQGTAASALPTAQFKNAFTPVANLTTLPVKSSFALQTDLTVLFNYNACGLSIDVGYNYWALSCERLRLRNDEGSTPLASGTVWALKGDAFVYGFAAAGATNPPAPGTPIALSATETGCATIYSGCNALADAPFPNQNPGIDNPEFALYAQADATAEIVVQPGQPAGAATQQRTSVDPVFLSLADIDIASARTRGESHKLFAHLSYTWYECEDFVPYLGIGGKAEFGPRHHEPRCVIGSTCALVVPQSTPACSDCTSCQRTNISEWGIWLKGGLFFN